MIPTIERFLNKVSIYQKTCWDWKAHIQTNGYGQFKFKRKSTLAHRFIYEYYHGSINPKLTIDHLCRNRKCVNPDHLEQVTSRENTLRGNTPAAINARKTHCIRGHEHTPENTYTYHIGKRICKECIKMKYQKSCKKVVKTN